MLQKEYDTEEYEKEYDTHYLIPTSTQMFSNNTFENRLSNDNV